MVLIRKFEPEDLDQILQITFDTFPERYDPNVFISLHQACPNCFLVAEVVPGRIVGFLMGSKTDVDSARILLLAVKRDYRRRGIGSKILKMFLRDMLLQNIKKVELEVRVDNKLALDFYRKHGFYIVDIIPNFYYDNQSAYVLRKML